MFDRELDRDPDRETEPPVRAVLRNMERKAGEKADDDWSARAELSRRGSRGVIA